MTQSPPELTCREMVELMNDYLEGAMDPEERARFEEHLSFCDGCANFLHQIRETIHVTGALTEDQLEPQVAERLLDAFRGWVRDR